MVITYHGVECFKVVFGDTTIVFNPISKESTFKPARFGADIALSSIQHVDMNGVESVSQNNAETFIIDGPGEYEVRKVTVHGFPSTSSYGDRKRVNTIYIVSMEGMHLCFLGALDTGKLPLGAREKFPPIDILFVPIGGKGTLSASDAHELSVELEPHIIIPMHYPTSSANVGEKNALAVFLKEEGTEGLKTIDKLTVKKKDVSEKEGEVFVLSA